MTSAGPTLPSKADRFQSSLTEQRQEHLREVQPHMKPQEGAVTLFGELRAGPLAVQGGIIDC